MGASVIKTYKGCLIRKANRWDRFIAFFSASGEAKYAVHKPDGKRLWAMFWCDAEPTFATVYKAKKAIDAYNEHEAARRRDDEDFELL